MGEVSQPQERASRIYECLAHTRRRHALHYLSASDTPVALADLAEAVARREASVSGAEISDKAVKDVYMSLYHNHIQKLSDAELVQYNQEQDSVTPMADLQELRSESPPTESPLFSYGRL